MTVALPKGVDAVSLVKRMMFLAYQASQIVGMGILQARNGVTEEEVWCNINNAGDYQGADPGKRPDHYRADYVFGRMMKLYIKVEDENVILHDGTPRSDYQSWCVKYSTYASLAEAALASLLGKGVTEKV